MALRNTNLYNNEPSPFYSPRRIFFLSCGAPLLWEGSFLKTRQARKWMVSRSCSALWNAAKTIHGSGWRWWNQGVSNLQYLYLQWEGEWGTWFGFWLWVSYEPDSEIALDSNWKVRRNWSDSDRKLFFDTIFSPLMNGKLFYHHSSARKMPSAKKPQAGEIKQSVLKGNLRDRWFGELASGNLDWGDEYYTLNDLVPSISKDWKSTLQKLSQHLSKYFGVELGKRAKGPVDPTITEWLCRYFEKWFPHNRVIMIICGGISFEKWLEIQRFAYSCGLMDTIRNSP